MSKAFSELKLDSSVVDTRSYDDGGRMTTDVLGNGITETRAYRTDNLLSGISFSNTNIGNLTYTWDANKNKTAETIAGVMSGYGLTSSGTAYDDEDRLTGYQRAATSGAAVLAQSWALTTVGDWSSVTTNGTAVTRTHGPTHELLTSGGQNVTTDVKGNQTVLPASLATQAAQLAFAWDFDNKLKSSDIDNNGSADVTFEYDALGRRVARTEGSTAVVYFQADQQTIANYPRGGAASAATYRYVFASYIDEPVVRKTTGTSGTVLYYHRNQQYSILALTDSSGNVSERYAYTAYGQPTFLNASATVQTSSAAGNRYTYTAREWDATFGLYHFRARWMSGLTGRFLTRDPIGYIDGYDLYVVYFGLDSYDPLGEQRGPPPRPPAPRPSPPVRPNPPPYTNPVRGTPGGPRTGGPRVPWQNPIGGPIGDPLWPTVDPTPQPLVYPQISDPNQCPKPQIQTQPAVPTNCERCKQDVMDAYNGCLGLSGKDWTNCMSAVDKVANKCKKICLATLPPDAPQCFLMPGGQTPPGTGEKCWLCRYTCVGGTLNGGVERYIPGGCPVMLYPAVGWKPGNSPSQGGDGKSLCESHNDGDPLPDFGNY